MTSTYGLSGYARDELRSLVEPGATILELGTGDGTPILAETYNVISIEDQPEWHVGASRLIHVPLVDCRELQLPDSFWKHFKATTWYDVDILKTALEGLSYDALIVDGPGSARNRAAMSHFYKELFDTSVPVIVDDIHRNQDWAVARQIARVKGSLDFQVSIRDFEGHRCVYAVIK